MSKKTILLILLALWGFLAISSVGYNILNTTYEIKNWYFLTDTQKRQKIFGDLYDFLIFAKNESYNPPKILVFSKDVRTHYFGMYMLYPTKIIDTNDEKKFLKMVKTKEFIYVATYSKTLDSNTYRQVATFSSKTTKTFGILYKKK